MEIHNERFVLKEKSIKRSSAKNKDPKKLLDSIESFLRNILPLNSDFLRYAIVETNGNDKIIEVAVLSEKEKNTRQMLTQSHPFSSATHSVNKIHDFQPNLFKEKFVVANIVPTGVRAEFGGWIGDATPTTNVLAEIADVVITHPNVLNGAFLNCGADNVLYTEGYLLDKFFRNEIALKNSKKCRANNKIGIILDKGALEQDENSLELAINAIETYRAILGIDVIDYIITDKPIGGKAVRMKSGAFGGIVKNPETFLKPAAKLIKMGAQAIAIGTYISISKEDLDAYFRKEVPNPYGGTEALISHTISKKFNIPSAHAPILPDHEKKYMLTKGVVDPRIAGEAVTTAYMGSILKGLHFAPQPVPRTHGVYSSTIKLEDVRAVVVPYTACGGIPVLAAQKYNIPVLAVKENNTCLDVTPEKLGLNSNVIVVENYLEAFGILATLKTGVSIKSVRRPLKNIK